MGLSQKHKTKLIIGSMLILLSACVSPINYFSKLPPGQWRAVLYLDQSSQMRAVGKKDIEFRTDVSGQLPFIFEVSYDQDDKMMVEIINGDERIAADNVIFGRDLSTAKDTVLIEFSVYDCYIKAVFEEHVMEGRFYVSYRDNYSIPFKAKYGINQAFNTDGFDTTNDINGSWEVIFSKQSEDAFPAVAEFTQKGNQLTGTFMTETGDYRYLYGFINGNKFTLAAFDVAHAYLFEAKILEDGTITGIFRSGNHYVTDWSAKKSDRNLLKSATQLTSFVDGHDRLKFELTDTDGALYDIKDEKNSGKPKIIFITASWCPNCKDMGEFLKEYYNENSAKVEIIAISFERYKDEGVQKEKVRNYKEKMGYPFKVLVGGHYNKNDAASVFGGAIDKIVAYPTLLFLDKENTIKGSYTGMYGPATSKYDEFKNDFFNQVQKIQ